MAAPWEQCSECNSECDVEETTLRPFDRTDPSQLSIHDHSPEKCAECIKAGTWCKQAQRLSKRSPQQYDKALRNYLEKTSTSSSPWKTFGQEGVNDGGLEKVIVENNIAFTIQLFPLKFLFPTGNPFAHSLSLSNTRTQCLSLFFPLSFSLLFSPFHYSFPDSLSHTLTFSSLSLSLARSLWLYALTLFLGTCSQSLFLGKQRLVLEESLEAGLLLHNNAPSSMDTFRDVLTALNFIIRLELEGVEEGAWYNNIVDLFLKNSLSSSSSPVFMYMYIYVYIYLRKFSLFPPLQVYTTNIEFPSNWCICWYTVILQDLRTHIYVND